MKSIEYVRGDVTAPQETGKNQVIVHICNDIGGWGLGFVLALSKRWEAPELAYRQWFEAGGKKKYLPLGAVQLVQVEEEIWVANVIGQHKIEAEKGIAPIRYEALREGLRRLARKAMVLRASVHMPRIGCGLAGGNWEKVGPIVEEQLTRKNIEVKVYDYKPSEIAQSGGYVEETQKKSCQRLSKPEYL